jgi:hypothetical protein
MIEAPIPERMKALPRDPRGYCIPVNVYRDQHGRPHFTINNSDVRDRVLARDLCGICGQPLTRGRWFVGGPLSAFHEHGAYIDPPMHHECAEYSLRVCPYLALPSYRKRIEEATLPKDDPTPILIDETMLMHRPPMFVAAMARGQRLLENGHIVPRRPFIRVEYWRDGAMLTEAEAMPLLEQELQRDVSAVEPRTRIIRRK